VGVEEAWGRDEVVNGEVEGRLVSFFLERKEK